MKILTPRVFVNINDFMDALNNYIDKKLSNHNSTHVEDAIMLTEVENELKNKLLILMGYEI